MARAPLEAALAASWTRANLAVYGDYLQAIHDPRGELIAIDLHLFRNGSSPELQARRTQLLAQLGMATYDKSDVIYGFVTDLRIYGPDAGVEVFHRSPLSPYLRGITVWASLSRMKHDLGVLAQLPHPWLRRITLRTDTGTATRPLLSKRMTTRLIAATPRLELIEIHGVAEPLAYAHPTARVERAHGLPRTKLEIATVGAPPDLVELGRFMRLHDGIADELADPAREAWAELRFVVDELVGPEPSEVPSELLACAIDALDLASYYGQDWQPIRVKLAADPVRLRRV